MLSFNHALIIAIVDLLAKIPGMDRPDIRYSLLVGFSPTEKSVLHTRRSDDMLTDLGNIVELADNLGKLDILIGNAKRRAQSETSRKQLDAFLEKLRDESLSNTNSSAKPGPGPLRLEQAELNSLVRTLSIRLNLEDLRTLSFGTGVDFDNLGGEGKEGKVRELVLYLNRRDRIQDFLRVGKEQRPDIDWDETIRM